MITIYKLQSVNADQTLILYRSLDSKKLYGVSFWKIMMKPIDHKALST